MSLSSDLFKNQRLDREERIKKGEIKQMILNNYLNENRDEHYIYRLFNMRTELQEQICSNHYWEETREGFETRTDFAYDPDLVEITFVSHRIIKQDGEYTSDGTELSERHLKANRKALASLIKTDRIIDSYYKLYQEGIDRDLKNVRTLSERTIDGAVNYDLRSIDTFLLTYRRIGLDLLIKWLNKLTEPNQSLDDLLEEFLNDVNNAVIIFETGQDSTYLDAVNKGKSLEKELMDIMDLYLPRAFKLHVLYNTKKRKLRGVLK